VRILFTFVGGAGHFLPLTSLARAARRAGHTVAISGQPSMLPTIRTAGFDAFPTGPNLGDTGVRTPLLKLGQQREERDLRDGFANRTARARAKDIITLSTTWNPAVIVCDEVDFGSMIAAESLGIPYASVIVIGSGSFIRKDVVGEALNEVRAGFGLPPDPQLRMLHRHLVFNPFPPSFRDPAFPPPPTSHPLRPQEDPAEAGPPWLENLTGPTVYLTLGTIFNTESGDLFTRALTGLRDLPTNLIVTVGRHIDPAEFGPQPANVHIEQFIPQSLVLPHVSLVVSHGGSGSVTGALTHGRPAVLIPMGADQPLNAKRCTDLGVAIALDPISATPRDIHDAARTVLGDPPLPPQRRSPPRRDRRPPVPRPGGQPPRTAPAR
jgi:UDP:flavonoid glycosyltransferase YjiC (YdhE family)